MIKKRELWISKKNARAHLLSKVRLKIGVIAAAQDFDSKDPTD